MPDQITRGPAAENEGATRHDAGGPFVLCCRSPGNLIGHESALSHSTGELACRWPGTPGVSCPDGGRIRDRRHFDRCDASRLQRGSRVSRSSFGLVISCTHCDGLLCWSRNLSLIHISEPTRQY